MSSNTSLLCQQSCLAPLVIEAIVLTQQFAPSKHDLSLSLTQKQCETDLLVPLSGNKKHCLSTENKNGGWNFLQSLTNTSSYDSKQTANGSEKASVYVHPLTKSSSSMSTRSLEMCTETLGSETGTHIMDEFTYLAIFENQSSCRNSQPTLCKKTKHVTSFPPPLTTIGGNGGGGVEMRARREEGRLVIEAVVSSSKSCFKAERENGRLRLSLVVKDDCNLGIGEEEEEEVEVENKRREDGRRVGRRFGSGGGGGGGRCSGDGSGGRKNLPTLPFCVAIS